MDIQEIRNMIVPHRKELEERFYVKKIALFGSYARGEQNEDSDIDILVEFSKPVDFFKYLDLEEELEHILHKKVDLFTEKTLKPFIREYVMQDLKLIG